MKRVLIFLVAAVLLVGTSVAQTEDKPSPAGAGMKPALIVIDVQNEFLPYMSELDVKRAPNMINGAIWMFRQRGLPVIRVYHTDPKWGPAPDSPGFQFMPSITVLEDDPKVVKNYPSAFKKTELEKLLRDQGINTLFLCGLSSTGCVLATYHGAQDLDFDVFMVKDGLIGPDPGHTNVIEEICESVTFKALQVMLGNVRS